MATVVDRGKEGPHPDLVSSVLKQLNGDTLRDVRDVDRVLPSDVQVLQQRTTYRVPWTNLWDVKWAYDQDTVEVDVSVGLAVISPSEGRKHAVQYMAMRLPDRDWGVPRMSVRWLEVAPTKPWISFPSLARGLGIAWGLIPHSTGLERVRMSLEDGQIAESMVSNGSALLFVPFHTARLWESTVRFGFFDTDGREIVTEELPLDLESLEKQP